MLLNRTQIFYKFKLAVLIDKVVGDKLQVLFAVTIFTSVL